MPLIPTTTYNPAPEHCEGFPAWLVPLTLLACGLGYTLTNFIAWGWPSVDGYPAIERFLDPSFLAHDFYVNTTNHYNVDSAQALFFGTLQKLTGIHYTLWQAGINLLRCLLLPLAVYGFVAAFTRSRNIALVTVVLATLANFSLPRTPGWAWLWGDPSPAMYAIFFILLAWRYILLRRPWIGFLLIALTSFIHPLVTVHGCIFIALIYLFDYTAREKWQALREPQTWVSGILFVTVFLFQYLKLSPDTGERLSTADYVNIVAFIRHPGDFIPSLFLTVLWWHFGVALIALAAMFASLAAEKNAQTGYRLRLLLAGIISYLIICLCGYLFVELWPTRFFVQLIPFRMVMMGAPLMFIIIGCYTVQQLQRGRMDIVLLVVLAACAESPYAPKQLPLMASPLLLLAAVIVQRLLPTAFFEARVASPWRVPAGIALGGLALAVVLALATRNLPLRKHDFQIPTVANQHPVYQWMRDNTRAQAVFLVDQKASSGAFRSNINPQKIRLIGHRAVLISMDFPFLDQDMKAWNARWQTALNNGEEDFIQTATAQQLLSIHRQYPFDYVLRSEPLSIPPELAREIRQVKTFGLFNWLDALYVYRISD